MTRQFEPRSGFNNSQEALQSLLKLLAETDDVRLALWASEDAVEACKQKIISRQHEIIRCERFNYTEDIARLKQSLANAEACYKIALATNQYLQWVSIEGGSIIPASK